jgi:hypothetical protein
MISSGCPEFGWAGIQFTALVGNQQVPLNWAVSLRYNSGLPRQILFKAYFKQVLEGFP